MNPINTMKHNLIALSFAAAVLFAGCAKENFAGETVPEDEKYVELKLNASFAETKTMLGKDAHAVEWKKGDAVSVFIGGTNYEFTADESGASASFTCNEVKESDAASKETIYAVYPYGAEYKLNGKTIGGIVVPAVQTLVSGSYDPAANVSVASGTVGGGLAFKNVCTLVKVHLDAETAIRGAQLTCPSGFALAGNDLAVDAETAEISFPENYAGCTNTVNLINNTKEGVDGTDFYMAVAPNSENGDFKLSVFDASEKYASKAFTTTKEFLRGKIITVNSAAPSKDSYVHYGTANCICLYGVPKDKTITVDATPYIASDSFIATGLISYSTQMPKTGNMWRENMFKGLSYKAVSNNTSTDGKLDLKVKRSAAETDSDKFGNMSFPLLSGTDTVWSYHVWSPEDNPDETLLHNGYEVMPMALGAINSTYTKDMDLSRLAGCFYQWGRKDPFGRRDVTSNKFVATSGKTVGTKKLTSEDIVAYGVMNPSVLIDNTSTKDAALWGNPEGYGTPDIVSKSIYDPCPEGYMVAPSDVYAGVVAAANVKHTTSDAEWTFEKEFSVFNGYLFGDDLMSASGYRSGANSYGGKSQAHYWTSSFKAEGSKYPFKVFFDNTEKNFNPKAGSGSNSQACCVRCVKVK